MQRALFARLLLQDAAVILLDEPFTAIDAKTTADLLDLVRRWRDESRTVVAVLHDLDMVRRIFPETLLIAREPLAWGDTGAVLNAANLLKARRMIEAHDPTQRRASGALFKRLPPLGEAFWMPPCFTTSSSLPSPSSPSCAGPWSARRRSRSRGGPVGVFLMLRRMSLTGDAMAHAILPGAAVGYLVAGLSLPAMTLGGFAAGCIVAVLAGLVARATALKEDASLAAFYLLSLALGVTLVSLRGSNVDLLHVLFGTVLALDDAALLLLGGIATLTLVGACPPLSPARPGMRRSGVPAFGQPRRDAGPSRLSGLLVLNLVGGFQALGTLLAVGLMMLPAAAARFWSADVSMMIVIATGIGLISSASGLLMSFHAGLPAGPGDRSGRGGGLCGFARVRPRGRAFMACVAGPAPRGLRRSCEDGIFSRPS